MCHSDQVGSHEIENSLHFVSRCVPRRSVITPPAPTVYSPFSSANPNSPEPSPDIGEPIGASSFRQGSGVSVWEEPRHTNPNSAEGGEIDSFPTPPRRELSWAVLEPPSPSFSPITDHDCARKLQEIRSSRTRCGAFCEYQRDGAQSDPKERVLGNAPAPKYESAAELVILEAVQPTGQRWADKVRNSPDSGGSSDSDAETTPSPPQLLFFGESHTLLPSPYIKIRVVPEGTPVIPDTALFAASPFAKHTLPETFSHNAPPHHKPSTPPESVSGKLELNDSPRRLQAHSSTRPASGEDDILQLQPRDLPLSRNGDGSKRWWTNPAFSEAGDDVSGKGSFSSVGLGGDDKLLGEREVLSGSRSSRYPPDVTSAPAAVRIKSSFLMTVKLQLVALPDLIFSGIILGVEAGVFLRQTRLIAFLSPMPLQQSMVGSCLGRERHPPPPTASTSVFFYTVYLFIGPNPTLS